MLGDGEMAISAHSQANVASRAFCDKLYEELSELIPDLQKNPTKGSCGIWQKGRTRFAYVYHSKTRSQIEVWCRGDKDDLLAGDPGLDVRARDNPKQGWEESFPARFRMYRTEQIPQAAQYLCRVSFVASSLK